MQEEIEQKSIAITVQATKLTGRVLKTAIAAALRKMEKARNTPKVGRNSLKRFTRNDPNANTIEVSGRIWSFERIARQKEVRYFIEKQIDVRPPKWTVYFKAGQADAITEAFKLYTRREMKRENKPSMLAQLDKFKELAKNITRPKVRNKERGGPDL